MTQFHELSQHMHAEIDETYAKPQLRQTDRYPNQDLFWPTSSLDPNRQVKFNMVTLLTYHFTNYDLYNEDNPPKVSLL